MPMLNLMLSARNDFGRTFLVAMWLLGTLAAAQVIAVGWAVVTFPKNAGTNSTLTSSPTPGTGLADDPALAYVNPSGDPRPGGTPNGLGGLPIGGGQTAAELAAAAANIGGLSTDPTLGSTPLVATTDQVLPGPSVFPNIGAISGAAGTENPAHTISHPAARRQLALAMEERANGNMQAALRSLRDAQALSPNHPRVLSELASTYSQMGLHDKAAEYWRSVFVLGTERAGAFYDLADMALKGNRIEDDGVAVAPVLSLGAIQTIERELTTEGEKVTIRIPVESRPGTLPNPADMAMLVYFYDQVNGEDYSPTTADTAENFVSEPYDWQDGGVEVIEESYFQPVFTDAQKKELGERRYFGYIVELYYRDELQDVVAEPQELMSLKPGQPESEQLPAPETEFENTPTGPGAELFPQQ